MTTITVAYLKRSAVFTGDYYATLAAAKAAHSPVMRHATRPGTAVVPASCGPAVEDQLVAAGFRVARVSGAAS
jgi:hypothetical protein